MHSLQEICDNIEKKAGYLADDEGIQIGNPNRLVKTIMICWMANKEAIDFAIQEKVELIICHESLFFPYDAIGAGGNGRCFSWEANRMRLEKLTKNNISVIRAHATIDTITILDKFSEVINLRNDHVKENVIMDHWLPSACFKIDAIRYGDLCDHIKNTFGLKHIRRTQGDPNRMITSIGLGWGGMALFVNVDFIQKLYQAGAQVIIAGESDNYGFQFVNDSSMDMIEVGHDISENPGLEEFTNILAKEYPDCEVKFFETKPPFVIG